MFPIVDDIVIFNKNEIYALQFYNLEIDNKCN